MKNVFTISFLFVVLLSGCGKVEQENGRADNTSTDTLSPFRTTEEKENYIAELRAYRSHKDSFLKSSQDSPIKKAERKSFDGLKYYDFDQRFVVTANLALNENPTPMTMTTTTGTTRKAVKYGYLKFSLLATRLQLGAYKFIDRTNKTEQESLFVPFTDSTSGRETYGAGRYLDLEVTANGEYLLDFNYAYNPYCAYNENYSCPIPPRENRLAASVTAGEKLYH